MNEKISVSYNITWMDGRKDGWKDGWMAALHRDQQTTTSCTCWSSGVQIPQVIWLSRLISEDQWRCPLTEPTNTKPSRYAISAWVPSWDQVKSLTCWSNNNHHVNRRGHVIRAIPLTLAWK